MLFVFFLFILPCDFSRKPGAPFHSHKHVIWCRHGILLPKLKIAFLVHLQENCAWTSKVNRRLDFWSMVDASLWTMIHYSFSMMGCYKRADLLSFRIRQVREVVVSAKERCLGMKITPLCIDMVLLGSLFHLSSTGPVHGNPLQKKGVWGWR